MARLTRQVKHTHRKTQIIALLLFAGLLIGGIVVCHTIHNKLNVKVARMDNQIADKKNQLAVQKQKVDDVRVKVVEQQLGIQPKQLDRDQRLIRDFIKPAFEWKNGEEYESHRQAYIKQFGKDNSFIQKYMTQNTKVKNGSETINKIDVFKMKSTFHDAIIYPMNKEQNGTAINYFIFVEFYVYQNDSDLQHANTMEKSKALLQVRVTGEEGNRVVSGLEGYSL